MKITFDQKGDRLSVRFVEERTVGRWLSLLLAICIAALAEAAIAVTTQRNIVACVAIGALCCGFIFVALRNLFSVCEMEISPQNLSLTRRLGFFSNASRFVRADVDWLGYAPELNGYQNHQDSGLLILVRQNVMPIPFARTITPDEARAVFTELKNRTDWIGPLIRPVGTPPF